MAAFNKFNNFVEHIAEKVHNLQADTLKVMLTNVAPVATNTLKGDLTEIAAGNGYTAGGNTVTVSSSAQLSAGIYALICADSLFTASGGAIAAFRYVVLYNDTPTSPLKPLIGFWDYGASVSPAVGETFLVDFDNVNGVLQLT